MYKIVRNILFLFPPEWVHYFSMNVLKVICSIGFLRKLLAASFSTHDSRLMTHVFNLQFKNPVGLGAGFDKNAKYLRELECFGFGFIEIGTVTPLPQAGNDKPRLFRLPKDKALINRMGFNNDGVKAVAERLKVWKESSELRVLRGKTPPSSTILRPRSRRGFLLLEAMLAVAIFALAMLALARCVQNCLQAEKFRRAEGLAQRALANYFVQVESGAIPLTDKATEELKGAYAGMTMVMMKTDLKLTNEKDQEIFGLFDVNLDLSWVESGDTITRSMKFILYPRQK